MRRCTSAICGALIALALAGVAQAAERAPRLPGVAQAAERAPRAPANLLLRLPDVGRGYVVGDSFCFVLAGEGVPWALTRLYVRSPHRGCAIQLSRLWTPAGATPGSPFVQSAAIRFRTVRAAAAELHLARDAVATLAGVSRGSLRRVEMAATVGDRALLFRTEDAPFESAANRPSTAVLWRSGRVLGYVLVGGLAPAAGAPEALRLAALQQGRIETPTPVRRADYDDVEASLDNPGLGIEVHWLGRRFAPGGGLPRMTLQLVDGPVAPGGGPGWQADLEYGVRRWGSDVRLGLWKPDVWARFVRTRFGQLVWHERCVRTEHVPLPDGEATIYGGYATTPKTCGRRAPDRYLAHVHFEDVVVSVNIPICWTCRRYEGGGPYDSFAGMRAIVSALRLRPQVP